MSSDDGDKIPELENNIKILKTTLNAIFGRTNDLLRSPRNRQ
ncbi:2404_t:CDS:2, partial [Entrophospora sp. SA101]